MTGIYGEGKRPVIVVTGPTAVGKTDAAVELAERLGGEIVSADSMQVYRHMDIGTAKVRPEEMHGIKHYLIDVIEPSDEFNVVTFKKMAGQALEEIYEKGKIPVIAGGTGFYIQALLKDVDFVPEETDRGYREELQKRAESEGSRALHDELKAKDPLSAQAIPENNVKRVIRALEFYRTTGISLYEHDMKEKSRPRIYDTYYFVLTRERAELYRRINLRVDKMFSEGLFEEVLKLRKMGVRPGMTSMQGIGYREFCELDRMISAGNDGRSLEEATEDELARTAEQIKTDTRHFAKRQLTWFRHEDDTVWIDRDRAGSAEKCVDEMLDKIASHRRFSFG